MIDCNVLTFFLGYGVGIECTTFLMYAFWITWKPDLEHGFLLIPLFWPLAVPVGTLIVGGWLISELTSNLKKVKTGPQELSSSCTSLAIPFQVYIDRSGRRYYVDQDGVSRWV